MAPEVIDDGVRQVLGEVADGPTTDEALLALDSIALVELVVRLEERFRIEIPDTALSDAVFESVQNLCALVSAQLSRTGS